jgi:hypothetical protein
MLQTLETTNFGTDAPVPAGFGKGARFARVQTRMAAVLVDLHGGRTVRGRIRNVSLGGMFFEGPTPLPVGGHCVCALALDGSDPGEVFIYGEVVHVQPDGLGLCFERLDGEAFQAISDRIGAVLAP